MTEHNLQLRTPKSKSTLFTRAQIVAALEFWGNEQIIDYYKSGGTLGDEDGLEMDQERILEILDKLAGLSK